MKKAAAHLSSVILLANAALATAGGWGLSRPYAEGLQVGIVTDRTVAKPGETVKLTILVLNSSERTLRLPGPGCTTVSLHDGASLIPCPGLFSDLTPIDELHPHAVVTYTVDHVWEKPGTYRPRLVWSDTLLGDHFMPLIRKATEGADRSTLRIAMDQAPPEKLASAGREGAFRDLRDFSVSTPSVEVMVRE